MTIASALVSLVLLLQAGTTPPKFSARLLAAHESVPPGGQTELLVEIEVDKPWHIYDPIVLDTGLATTVKFTTPPGVTIGELRYPAPKLGQTAGFEYLEHAGTIRAIASLTLAPDVQPGRTLAISADVSGLACIEMCVPVRAAARLELAVTAEQGKLTNEKSFKEARDKLAPLLADAPYIKGSGLRVSKDRLTIGEPAELIATIRVQKGHHIQDRDPGVDTLIASRLFIEKIPGLEFAEEEKQTWPTPHVRDIPYVGKVREQSGEVTIRVPFQITDAKFPSGPVTARVLFQYQACTEAGQCFPPKLAAGLLRFLADTPNPPAVAHTEPVDEPTASQATSTAAVGTGDESAIVDERGPAVAAAEASSARTFLLILALAFLGGLILNVMPCVLPVISIKILSFMQQGAEDPKRVFRLGIVFCAGIMVWFWLFAALSMTSHVPLQYPPVVIAVGTILFVLSLNLFGVFEITLPGAAAGKLDEISRREGYGGAFFKGFLATLLGTACTAPFLATALVYAASQPWFIGLLVFTAAGLGMSSPYFLLSVKPAWMKFIPKPGMWMVTFKQGMSFILLGTAVWLLWILGHQMGADGVVWTVAFWGFLGVAAWMVGKTGPTWRTSSRWATWAGAAVVALVGYWFSYHVMYEPPSKQSLAVTPEAIIEFVSASTWEDGIPWAPYGKGIPQELARRGYTVYVDYTASWCPTCLANKAIALEIDATRSLMRRLGVIPIKADFTNRDPRMLAEIIAFGRPTVPLNVIYPAGRPRDVIKLPVLLTPGIVATNLNAAGPSQGQPELARTEG